MSGTRLLTLSLALLLTTRTWGQTAWQEYPNNPVIAANIFYAMDPAVIYDSVAQTYRMWYTADSEGRYVVFYATSADGLHWTKYSGNPVLKPGTGNEWDGVHARCSAVVFDGEIYRMYYFGSGVNSREQIGLATSSDGIHWEKYPHNPVLQPSASGAWDDVLVYHPEVYFDGETFYMWYAGYNGVTVRGGLATSADGVQWSKHPNNPVLKLGSAGAWDDHGVWPNGGIVRKDDEFYLLYSGASSSNSSQGALGLATSSDGVQWKKYAGNPVLEGTPGAWNQAGLGPGAMLFDGQRFQLWFAGHFNASNTWQIGYAESGSASCDGIPLPAGEAYGNINPQNQTHPEQVTYCFEAPAGDRYLSFAMYDIDLANEVRVSLNGETLLHAPITANNTWSSLAGVLLSDAQIRKGQANTLVFDNTRNPPQGWRWGVRQVSVDPFYALPSPAAYGNITGGDTQHGDKVVYFFSGQPGDLNLAYQIFDIDHLDEVDIVLNATKLHDEALTSNESWSETRNLLLPDELVINNGINVLIFENTKNPPRNWRWGVRNVSVNTATTSALALAGQTSASVNGVNVLNGRYLMDSIIAPVARTNGDVANDTSRYVIQDATTIATNGYALIELPGAQQIDYLTLYPEWHAQRYFGYRVETSSEGLNWSTAIDKRNVKLHGAQLERVGKNNVRYLRLSGFSVVIDPDSSLASGLSESAYWPAYQNLLQQAQPEALAIAELVLLKQESSVKVDEPTAELPTSYRLEQNLPNPFNPSTIIRFDLPQAERVHLAIYNLRGELVATLVEGNLAPGAHAFTFDARGFASGVYFYRLSTEKFSATKKMLLAK